MQGIHLHGLECYISRPFSLAYPQEPETAPQHLFGLVHDSFQAFAELALRIRDHSENNLFDGHEISLRIGVNSGPVVAGIVGTHKFAYDLWGDVVNTASRMESEGVPGSIQVSPVTYELIRDKYVCEPRGVIQVKGKGEMNTYFLRGPAVKPAQTPP